MKKEENNIYSVFDEIIDRKEKEFLLQQNAKVIWLTGLSGSGKTSIAKVLEKTLHQNGFVTKLLDGDNVRVGINKNLSFSEIDRRENIRRIAEVSKLFLDCGIITICSFVSPTVQIRNLAKGIIGENDFLEVYVDTPLSVCERRDTKGLYKKARAGKISNFTGISAPFEIPLKPYLSVKTENLLVEESAQQVLKFIESKIKI